MADLIDVPTLETRLGRTFTGGELPQVQALITDASALVIDVVGDPDVTDPWDAAVAGSVPASVVPVVVAMVRRGLDNPHGFTQESTEGYSYSGASGAGVFATPSERRAIRRAVGKGGVGTLTLTSGLPVRVSWLDGVL